MSETPIDNLLATLNQHQEDRALFGITDSLPRSIEFALLRIGIAHHGLIKLSQEDYHTELKVYQDIVEAAEGKSAPERYKAALYLDDIDLKAQSVATDSYIISPALQLAARIIERNPKATDKDKKDATLAQTLATRVAFQGNQMLKLRELSRMAMLRYICDIPPLSATEYISIGSERWQHSSEQSEWLENTCMIELSDVTSAARQAQDWTSLARNYAKPNSKKLHKGMLKHLANYDEKCTPLTRVDAQITEARRCLHGVINNIDPEKLTVAAQRVLETQVLADMIAQLRFNSCKAKLSLYSKCEAEGNLA